MESYIIQDTKPKNYNGTIENTRTNHSLSLSVPYNHTYLHIITDMNTFSDPHAHTHTGVTHCFTHTHTHIEEYLNTLFTNIHRRTSLLHTQTPTAVHHAFTKTHSGVNHALTHTDTHRGPSRLDVHKQTGTPLHFTHTHPSTSRIPAGHWPLPFVSWGVASAEIRTAH